VIAFNAGAGVLTDANRDVIRVFEPRLGIDNNNYQNHGDGVSIEVAGTARLYSRSIPLKRIFKYPRYPEQVFPCR